MNITKIWEKKKELKEKIFYGLIGGFFIGFFQWNLFNYVALKMGGSPNSFALIFYLGSIFGAFYGILFFVSALLHPKYGKQSQFIIKLLVAIFLVISILMILFLLWNIKPIKDI